MTLLVESHLSDLAIDPVIYRRELLKTLDQASQLTDDGVEATLKMFAELQQDVRRTLLDVGTDATKELYQGALQDINQSITDFGTQYGLTLADLQAQGFDLGADIALNPLGDAIAGLTGISHAIPPNIAGLLQGYSADLVQGLTVDIRKRVNTEVISVLAGAKTPFDAANAIGRNLTDANHFSTVYHRGRAIMVTEIGRASALGTQGAQTELAEMVARDPDIADLKIRKRWINAHLPGARPEHLAAERRYHPDGSIGPIPIDDTYNVAGQRALYPRDPSLSAAQSVHCHCQSITWIPEMMEADPLADSQDELDKALTPDTSTKKATAPKAQPPPFTKDGKSAKFYATGHDLKLDKAIAKRKAGGGYSVLSDAELGTVRKSKWSTGTQKTAALKAQIAKQNALAKAAIPRPTRIVSPLGDVDLPAAEYPGGDTTWRFANDQPRTPLTLFDGPRLDRTTDEWLGIMTSEQREIVQAYTGGGYSAINRRLVGKQVLTGDFGHDLNQLGITAYDQLDDAIETLFNAIEDAPTPTAPVTSWRLSRDTTGDLVKALDAALGTGDEFVHVPFASTTLDTTTMVRYPSKVALEIRSTSGAWVKPISQFSVEDEWLIQAGTKFKVVGKTTVEFQEGGKTLTRVVYQLEEV